MSRDRIVSDGGPKNKFRLYAFKVYMGGGGGNNSNVHSLPHHAS